MEEELKKVQEARMKLKNKFGKSTQIGGKGTQRRKNRQRHKKKQGEDKVIQNLTSKMGAQKLPDIKNINLFTDDNKVIQFENPQVFGSFQNQTIICTGDSKTRDLKDCLSEVMSELGPKQLEQLKKENIVPEEPIPELEETKKEETEEKPKLENFEDVANK